MLMHAIKCAQQARAVGIACRFIAEIIAKLQLVGLARANGTEKADEVVSRMVKAHELLKRPAPGSDFEDRFAALMRFQCERAQQVYDQALGWLPEADRRGQKPGLMMASIYRSLLKRIQQDPVQVLHRRVRLTPLHKFYLAWRVQALGRL